jgi:ribosomal protein S14
MTLEEPFINGGSVPDPDSSLERSGCLAYPTRCRSLGRLGDLLRNLYLGRQVVHQVSHALGLIGDRKVRVPRLKDVDRHIVPVSDLLPANKEML